MMFKLDPKKLRDLTWSQVYRFLGSRGFSYFSLISVAGLLLMWVVPFQIYGVPAWRVQNIANKVWFFRFSYILAYLSLVLCMTQLAVRNLKRRPITERIYRDGAQLSNLPNYEQTDIDTQDVLPKLLHQLKNKGYKVVTDGPGLYGVKGEQSRWGTVIFHLGLIPIILGVFVSLGTSFYGETIATEGQSFVARSNAYTAPSAEELAKLRDRLPEFSFKVNQVRPAFWEDKLLFTNLEADVAYPADTEERFATVRLNSPLYDHGTFLELAGFGYSPYFVLKDKDGKTVNESFVNLGIFPSGSEDYFQVPGLPYEIHVIIWSDPVFEGGNPHSKSYNLSNPLYTVYVVKDKEPPVGSSSQSGPGQPETPENKQLVVQGNYKPGEPIKFEGYTLTFPDFRYYGQFRIIYDPGVFFVFAGFVMMVLGLFWRLFFYRQQVWAVTSNADGGTQLHFAGTCEFFRESFKEELANLWRQAIGSGRKL